MRQQSHPEPDHEATDRADFMPVFTDAVVLIGDDHRIHKANAAFRRQFNANQSVRGAACHEVIHGQARPCHERGEACPLILGQRNRRSVHISHRHEGTTSGVAEVNTVDCFPILLPSGMRTTRFLQMIQPGGCHQIQGQAASEVEQKRLDRLRGLLDLLTRVAATDISVLVQGETGTGKEVVARTIHELSSRSEASFVTVECSSLREGLLDSELFGHLKGAFTGAVSDQLGLVELSNGGTLYLDEIGDLPLDMQRKLLRLLETRSFRRVGEAHEREADFRLICSTHRDLQAMVEADAFRLDLYHRISAFPVHLVPLRERMDELPFLTEAIKMRLGCPGSCRMSPEALELLRAYSFPGNIRELLHILERACLLADGATILPEHLPVEVSNAADEQFRVSLSSVVPVADIERRYLEWAQSRFPGTRRELADLLGLSERTLYRKLRGLRGN